MARRYTNGTGLKDNRGLEKSRLFGLPLKEAIVNGLRQNALEIESVSTQSSVDSHMRISLDLMVTGTIVKEGYARVPEMEFDPDTLKPGDICPICAGLGCDPCKGEGVIPAADYDPYPEKPDKWFGKQEPVPFPKEQTQWVGSGKSGGSSVGGTDLEGRYDVNSGMSLLTMTHQLANGQKIVTHQAVTPHIAASSDSHMMVGTVVEQMTREVGRVYAQEIVAPQIKKTTQQIVDAISGGVS